MIDQNPPEKPEKEKLPLRILREQAQLTRPQVRQLIGVSERRQADWENGEAMPSAENLVALARLYKVSLKRLCTMMGIDVAGVPDDISGHLPDNN